MSAARMKQDSVGRDKAALRASQAECREFEPHLPLQKKGRTSREHASFFYVQPRAIANALVPVDFER